MVTFLEMREQPVAPVPASSLRLALIEHPRTDDYRRLFRLVGARWLWFSRLTMDDAALAAIIQSPDVELFAVKDDGATTSACSSSTSAKPGNASSSFIGLVPELSGKGHGRWLLAEAVDRAWRDGVTRVHVHTCSLDHPAALSAYRRAGFTAYKRAIERFPDPRLLGILPKTARLRSRCSEPPA